jgi:hypothetical protein
MRLTIQHAMNQAWDYEYYHVDESLLVDVPWCAHIAQLTRLQVLQIYHQLHLQCDDVLRLTGLTSLQSLFLISTSGLDDVCAVQLIKHLTGLTDLGLRSDNISSTALLPAVLGLTDLHTLYLSCLVHDARLAALTELNSLSCVMFDGVGKSVVLHRRDLLKLAGFEDDAVLSMGEPCNTTTLHHKPLGACDAQAEQKVAPNSLPNYTQAIMAEPLPTYDKGASFVYYKEDMSSNMAAPSWAKGKANYYLPGTRIVAKHVYLPTRRPRRSLLDQLFSCE